MGRSRFSYRREFSKLTICKDNKRFIQAVFKSRKRFEALRSFTLKSGQEEIERQKQRRKELAEGPVSANSPTRTSRNGSIDSARTPVSTRSPALTNVPEEGGAFAIGDDEDSDEEEDHDVLPTPSHSSPSRPDSRTPSVASSTDEPLPAQLRGMSEKARGKMPAGQPSFSRQNSMTSLNSHQTSLMSPAVGFEPSAEWVIDIHFVSLWVIQVDQHTDRILAAFPPFAYHTYSSIVFNSAVIPSKNN